MGVHREMIWFTGHVQGVGFRFSTLQVAREFEVAGDVANLPDGRVLLRVEGSPEMVRGFVAAVCDRLENFIKSTERRSETGPAQFSGFAIR